MDENRAIQEIKQGSEEALCRLIEQYTAYVSTIVMRVLGQTMSLSDVEEVTADVFLALWHNAASIQADGVKGWLGSVARNKAKNRLRQAKQELPLEENVLIIDGAAPEAALEKKERQQIVREAILSMDQPTRDIFLRHYYYCQGVMTISEEMQLNVSTVKSHLRRGREKLRVILQDRLL